MKMLRPFSVVLLIAITATGPVSALTLDEAVSLPLPELAHRVLGDDGNTVIDVIRPSKTWHCFGICPEPPSGPMPLGPIFFFTKARLFPTKSHSGLCVTDRIFAEFDEKGDVRHVIKQQLFGGSNLSLPNISARPTLREQQANCDADPDVKEFLNGPPENVESVGLGLQEIARQAIDPATISYKIDPCKSDRPLKPCETPPEQLRHLNLAEIGNIQRLPCSDDVSLDPQVGEPEFCFNVGFTESSGIWMKLLRDDEHGLFKVEEVKLTFGHIVY